QWLRWDRVHPRKIPFSATSMGTISPSDDPWPYRSNSIFWKKRRPYERYHTRSPDREPQHGEILGLQPTHRPKPKSGQLSRDHRGKKGRPLQASRRKKGQDLGSSRHLQPEHHFHG